MRSAQISNTAGMNAIIVLIQIITFVLFVSLCTFGVFRNNNYIEKQH